MATTKKYRCIHHSTGQEHTMISPLVKGRAACSCGAWFEECDAPNRRNKPKKRR